VAGKFVILTPLFDDWVSFRYLIEDISRVLSPSGARAEMIVVDDGSPLSSEPVTELPPDSCIDRVEIVRLASNLGHQRAIAVGLCCAAERSDIDAVIVMDGDGEDRPADILTLLDHAAVHPNEVIFAHRAKRSEGLGFKVGYWAYKLLFRLLTGQEISFGNFSFLPIQAVRRLVHMPELWNNLPGAIMRSRLRYRHVGTTRGRRYAGESKMNLPGLVVHGLSAMATYTDILFVRILLAAGIVCGVAVVAMGAVIAIRLATSLAIPGWATAAVGNLLVIVFLGIVMIVATTFMSLANRTNRPFVPISDTPIFIAERKMLVAKRGGAGDQAE